MDASTTEFLENGMADQRRREKAGPGVGAGGALGKEGGHHHHPHMLGEWQATALCGNDVMRCVWVLYCAV